jgi:5-methylcytosine-specific restriction endonuclease McrA
MTDYRTRGVSLQRLRKRVFDLYGDDCWLCHQGGADTIDHIIPLINGGTDDLDNLRPAHGRKSASCVGNYSRKRPSQHQGNRIREIDPSGLIITDDYIEVTQGQVKSKIYYRGFISLDEALVMARR